jgi:hypothetical protein
VNISFTALTALSDNLRLICGHISHDPACIGIAYESSSRHFYYKRRSALSGHISACAVLTAFSDILALISEIYQSREIIVDLKYDISASAAVSAIGTAGSDILFTVERHGAVAAIACLDLYFRLINEHF